MAYTVPGKDGRSRLYVADRAGRLLRRQPLARASCLGDVRWSPDETRLAYANYCDYDFSEVFVVGRNGRGRRKLARGQ
jgi:Tol biopolymer transport system component